MGKLRNAVYWLPLAAVVGITGVGTLQVGAEPAKRSSDAGLANHADALGCRTDDLVVVETIDYIAGARGWASADEALRGANRAQVVSVRASSHRVLHTAPDQVSWVASNDVGSPVAVTAKRQLGSWKVTNIVSCQRPVDPSEVRR